ncbi:DNA polymerase III subunit beta [Oceanibacterium hippocampi]|uniref:Beta sliding clamp n=1 Tax=Oceanibacterium hippocampi TaxID=745714 RepID=A0A1Y5TZH2_9PROT|nr:DNA polymerase III subunit beta [Oceanibacterium hippocampi]SLN77549.1 DNA polymerase III subunit beta [Oceanibacterium hippocampi]
MIVTVERSTLAAAAKAARNHAATGKDAGVLGMVLISAEPDGAMSLAATDMTRRFEVRFEAEVTRAGSALLPAVELAALADRATEGSQVRIEIDYPSPATARAGRSRWRMPVDQAENFPAWSGALTPPFEMPAGALRRLFSRTLFAAERTGGSSYFLMGVHLRLTGPADALRLVAVATNGHQLAIADCLAPAGSGGLPDGGVTVPDDAVKDLLGMLPKESSDPAAVAIGEHDLTVRFGDWTYYTRLIDGSFPDYERVIPPETGPLCTMPAPALRAALGRIEPMADMHSEKGPSTTYRVRRVEIDVGPSDEAADDGRPAMRLTAAGPDGRQAEDEIAVEWSGVDAWRTAFNIPYLVDFAAQAEPGAIAFRVHGLGAGNGPVLVYADGDLLGVIMPLRR